MKDRYGDSDPLWKYVNMRRLFVFVEESIDKGTQWAVFEPNGETTWTTMTQNDIRDGPLICVIGMAPVTPAAFVIFQDQPAHGKGRAHV